jgi:hypothetical protein
MARALVPWLRSACVAATFGFSLAVSFPLASRPLAAQEADPIAAHLEAGEFGPALAAADRLANPAQRDDALARIAAAQAAAGASEGSLMTAGSIGSDATRGRAIDQLRDAISGRGGGVIADFDTLIELITTTVDPDSKWAGQGRLPSFPRACTWTRPECSKNIVPKSIARCHRFVQLLPGPRRRLATRGRRRRCARCR